VVKRGDNYIVGIDLESGGFEPGRHSILAIGAYWRQTVSHNAVVFPEHTLRLLVERESDTVVEPAAAAKNGWVSDEQWLALGAVPLRNALDMFIMWLTKIGEKLSALTFEPLAHNHASVDRPFLEYWTARYDLRDMLFGTHGLLSHAWHDSMTTLRAAQVAGLVPAGGASLDAMLRAMGRVRRGVGGTSNIEHSTSNSEGGVVIHDAGEDARASFDGYHWLTELMKRGGVA
jgi:hypothetical protein